MDISFRSQRINSKTYEIPLFMDNSQSDGIIEIIENFEEPVGLKEDQFDSSFIFEIFSDTKIAKGLYFVLVKYFYDLKGLEQTKKQPFDLRMNLFTLMEENGISWANHRQQKQLLTTLSQEEKINILELEELLFADFSSNFKVVRRTEFKPPVLSVITQYNTEILKFLLNKSFYLSFTLPDFESKGFFIKNVIKNCKLLGLELDLEVHEESNTKNLLVSILGPNELVGRNIKYSNNLYYLFMRNLKLFQKEIQHITLEIQYFESKKLILLPFKNFPDLIDDSKEEIVYDSAIEKTFSEQWIINFPQWEIEREPLIIEKNLVMVPDFLLRYRNTSFYFEIVGFWTEKYLTKKSMKVSLLKSKYPNMILLVDRKLDWPEIDVPTFYYDKKIPILEIGSFLKKFELSELGDVTKMINFDQLKIIIDKRLESDSFMFQDELFKECKIEYPFELVKIIEEYFKYFKNDCKFVFFSNYRFIVSIEFLFEMKKFLSSQRINRTLQYESLKNQFSFITNETYFKVLLKYLGYDIKYRSLLDEELVFKKERVIKPEII